MRNLAALVVLLAACAVAAPWHSGTKTVGAGGDAPDLLSALHDSVGHLSGNLTISVTDSQHITSSIRMDSSLNSYTLKITSSVPNNGNPLAGNVVVFAHNNNGLDYRGEGAGVLEISDLRWRRLGIGTVQMFIFQGVTTAFTLEMHGNMIDGAYDPGVNSCRGIYVADGDPVLHIYNNVLWGLTSALWIAAGNSSSVYENNTFFANFSNGIDGGNQGGTYRNNVSYGPGTGSCFYRIGSATGANNVSSDSTAGDGRWGSGANNDTGWIAARDFLSTSDLSAQFMDIDTGGWLPGNGASAGLAGNTTGIRGRTRPSVVFGTSCGASEATSTADATESVNILVLGQSNASGRGIAAGPSAINDSVQIWHHGYSMWKIAAEPADNRSLSGAVDDDNSSADASFVTPLLNALWPYAKTKYMRAVMVTLGGSGLLPSEGYEHWSKRGAGSLFNRAVDVCTTAFDGPPDYAIYYQGEKEIMNTLDVDEWADSMRSLAQAIRDSLSAPTLPIFTVQNAGMYSIYLTKTGPMRLAQSQFDSAVAHNYFGAATYDLVLNGDSLHLSTSGQNALGQRLANSIAYLLGDVSYYRGPRLRTTRVSADSLSLYMLMDKAVATDADSICAFRFYVGASETEPVTVGLYNDATVKATWGTKVAHTISARYAYRPKIQNLDSLLHGTDSLALPVEPFVSTATGAIWNVLDSISDTTGNVDGGDTVYWHGNSFGWEEGTTTLSGVSATVFLWTDTLVGTITGAGTAGTGDAVLTDAVSNTATIASGWTYSGAGTITSIYHWLFGWMRGWFGR